MAYAVWFGLFFRRKSVWEYHFNVINYAVQNPTVNIMKDFSNDSVLQISQLTKVDAKSTEWSFY
jgi:hypothetical protein